MSLDLLLARAKAKPGASILRAYKFGDVPALPVAPYVVLSLDTGAPSTYSLDGSSDSMVRLTVQCFGGSYDAVKDMARRADIAFRDVVLTEIPGSPMCNREMQTPVVDDPDGEGLLYVLHTYRYQED